MTTDAEWMARQERDYNRGTFAGMSRRWRFPKPAPVIPVDRQLEIAMRALDAAEHAATATETGPGAPNETPGDGNTSLNVQPLRTALSTNTSTTENRGAA